MNNLYGCGAILNKTYYPANNDPWFHPLLYMWIHEFNWLNSNVSVCEFTRFCEQIWCRHVFTMKSEKFFTWWHVPLKQYQFWPSTTRVKLVQNCDNRQNMCIHVNTHENTYLILVEPGYQLWTSMTLVQKWFLNCLLCIDTAPTTARGEQ